MVSTGNTTGNYSLNTTDIIHQEMNRTTWPVLSDYENFSTVGELVDGMVKSSKLKNMLPTDLQQNKTLLTEVVKFVLELENEVNTFNETHEYVNMFDEEDVIGVKDDLIAIDELPQFPEIPLIPVPKIYLQWVGKMLPKLLYKI